MRKRTAKDYRVSCWSGGETREFLFFPDGASYAGRDFLWRVSSATVGLAEGNFTLLPDYRRFLTSLSDTLRLSQDGGAFRTLGAFEVLEFDSEAETRSRGEVTDFDLILRKGKAAGDMTTAMLGARESCRLADLFPAEAVKSDALLLYCYVGATALRCTEKEWVAEVGTYLLLSPEEGETTGLLLADTELLTVTEHTIPAFAWMRQYWMRRVKKK